MTSRPPQPLEVRRGIAQPALHGLEITNDHHEKIVEVMSDAAGKLADGFHFLCLPRPLVGSTAFCEVARNLGEADVPPVRTVDRIDDHARPEPAAILAQPPAFGLILPGFESATAEQI